jgi:ubiquitin C-terminal hydrolase
LNSLLGEGQHNQPKHNLSLSLSSIVDDPGVAKQTEPFLLAEAGNHTKTRVELDLKKKQTLEEIKSIKSIKTPASLLDKIKKNFVGKSTSSSTTATSVSASITVSSSSSASSSSASSTASAECDLAANSNSEKNANNINEVNLNTNDTNHLSDSLNEEINNPNLIDSANDYIDLSDLKEEIYLSEHTYNYISQSENLVHKNHLYERNHRQQQQQEHQSKERELEIERKVSVEDSPSSLPTATTSVTIKVVKSSEATNFDKINWRRSSSSSSTSTSASSLLSNNSASPSSPKSKQKNITLLAQPHLTSPNVIHQNNKQESLLPLSSLNMYKNQESDKSGFYEYEHEHNLYNQHQLQQHQQQLQQSNNISHVNMLSKKIRKLLPYNSGLKNHGNTCFMNCVLQCLFHTSPLAEFFVSMQFNRDMQIIAHQQQQSLQQSTQQSTQQSMQQSQQQQQQLPPFILTKHFYRLLNSMWRNAYEPSYSNELKNLIGFMNPTFAGVNQNDSHEFCLFLLDKLSQELTVRLPSHNLSQSKTQAQVPLNKSESEENSNEATTNKSMAKTTSSFIEELFQVEFKSIVICSNCNYESSKYETDMMISLPLPQSSTSESTASPVHQSKQQQQQQQQRHKQQQQQDHSLPTRSKYSLFIHLILTNPFTIRYHTHTQLASSSNPSGANTHNFKDLTSKSRFYVYESPIADSSNYSEHDFELNSINAAHSESKFIKIASLTSKTENTSIDSYSFAPFHVKVAVGVHLSSNRNDKREIIFEKLNNNESGDFFLILNPTLNDLRHYVANIHGIEYKNLVFVNLNDVNVNYSDSQPLKEFVSLKPNYERQLQQQQQQQQQQYHSDLRVLDSLCIVELNFNSEIDSQSRQLNHLPLINIVAINVYTESGAGSSQQRQQQSSYGLPFSVLINRDCSYTELCVKLLEAQSRFFKDKNILKYKELAEKLFTLHIVDSTRQQKRRLNASDELPLYAEFVDKALSESLVLSNRGESSVEYIKIYIEWRSVNDIQGLFRNIDFERPDFVHKSVKCIQQEFKFKESNANDYNNSLPFTNSPVNINENAQRTIKQPQQQQQQKQQQQQNQQKTHSNRGDLTFSTLSDCFELFTQSEELTDENSWACPKCKKQTNAYKKLSISAVPPILIIHLKRFFYKSNTTNFKLTTPVWFPVCSLDMSKYVEKRHRYKSATTAERIEPISSATDDLRQLDVLELDTAHDRAFFNNSKLNNNNGYLSQSKQADNPNRSYIYDLFAVCNHKGQNMLNGHYTAYCRNMIDTRWYCFDDASCSLLNESTPTFATAPSSNSIQTSGTLSSNKVNSAYNNNGSSLVCTENAYILFYKRRNCMRNEKWWLSFVDRSLHEHDEFSRFVANLALIEKQQHLYELEEQERQLSKYSYASSLDTSVANRATSSSSSLSGLNRIRKIIDNSFAAGANGRKSKEDSINSDLADSIARSKLEAVNQVNQYDEYNRPMRLLRNQMSKTPSSSFIFIGNSDQAASNSDNHAQADCQQLQASANSTNSNDYLIDNNQPVLYLSNDNDYAS